MISFLSLPPIAGRLEEIPVDKKNTRILGICSGLI